MCMFDFRPSEFPSQRNTCRLGSGESGFTRLPRRLRLGPVPIEQLAGARPLKLAE
jgi:hypothetical protein